MEHDRVQHPEHRGAGADADGQRNRGEHRNTRATVLELPPQGVPQVAPEILQPPRAAGVPAQLLHLVEAAELEARPTARFPRGHAGPDVVGHLPLDVVAQLGVELGFRPLAMPQPPEHSSPAHRAPPPAVPRISPTASASRAQLSASACNCARPLAVSR